MKKLYLNNKTSYVLILWILILTISIFSITTKCTKYDAWSRYRERYIKHQTEFTNCKIPYNILHAIWITLGIWIILYEVTNEKTKNNKKSN